MKIITKSINSKVYKAVLEEFIVLVVQQLQCAY